MTELLPCPFCGSSDIYFSSCGTQEMYAACNDCGVDGPVRNGEEAAEAWNRGRFKAWAIRMGNGQLRLGVGGIWDRQSFAERFMREFGVAGTVVPVVVSVTEISE